MKVSMIGALTNAADALEAWNKALGGENAEGDDADTIDDYQPAFFATVLRMMADNAERVKNNPALLDQFLELYCLRDPGGERE